MTAFLGAAVALFSAQDSALKEEVFYSYQKARLMDMRGGGLTKTELEYDTMYVFSYPYKATPAILVKKSVADENNVTRDRLYAYLAINPSTYEFANNDVSIVSYYHEDRFGNGVVRFCDDKNAYNIFDGTYTEELNVTGPALALIDINATDIQETNATESIVRESNETVRGTSRPSLIKVRIEEEPNGRIYATGLSDKEFVKRFFILEKEPVEKRFRSMWNAKYQEDKPRVLPLDKFSLVTVRCNNKKGL